MTFDNISEDLVYKDNAWTDSIEKWRPLSHISTVISYACLKKGGQNILLTNSTVKSYKSFFFKVFPVYKRIPGVE